MKSILMSIKPKWVEKILNGKKTIEVRKKFPVDYVGWVYIYCTKDLKSGKKVLTWLNEKGLSKVKTITYLGNDILGKVVARFWCDKVKPTYHFYEEELCALSCLTDDELFKYLGYGDGYAINITKLEIFDKPKELSEFKSYKKNIVNTKINGMVFETELDNSLIKAPMSWCYVEESL